MDKKAFNVALGRYLGFLFAQRGMSQRDIEAATGIKQDVISKDFRAGRPLGIKDDRLEEYLKLLGVSYDDVASNVLNDNAANAPRPPELSEQIARATELLEDVDDIREVTELLTRQFYRRQREGAQTRRRA